MQYYSQDALTATHPSHLWVLVLLRPGWSAPHYGAASLAPPSLDLHSAHGSHLCHSPVWRERVSQPDFWFKYAVSNSAFGIYPRQECLSYRKLSSCSCSIWVWSRSSFLPVSPAASDSRALFCSRSVLFSSANVFFSSTRIEIWKRIGKWKRVRHYRRQLDHRGLTTANPA